MNASASDSRQKAQETREDIDRLKGTAAFSRYYVARQQQRLEEAREHVLHGTFVSAQELWEARLIFQEREDAAGMLARDEAGARSTLGDEADAASVTR